MTGRKESLMKKHLYLITIEGDVEPEIIGPFKDQNERNTFAKEFREKYSFEGGIFPLDIKSDAALGKVEAWAYSGGFFEGDDEEEEGEEHEDHRSGQRGKDLETAGRDGSVALDGVQPVAFRIQEIVDDVDARGEEAEGAEGEQGLSHQVGMIQVPGEDQRREDEEVLDPLVHSQRLEEGEKRLHSRDPARCVRRRGAAGIRRSFQRTRLHFIRECRGSPRKINKERSAARPIGPRIR